MKQRAGLDIQHVPYRGSAPATQDLLADQLDMIFDNISTPLAQNGAARSRPRRHASSAARWRRNAGDGRVLPGFDINSWGGICGPAGLPPAIVEKPRR